MPTPPTATIRQEQPFAGWILKESYKLNEAKSLIPGKATSSRSKVMRPSGRAADGIRRVSFTPDFTIHAEGSVLAEFGDTRVLCTATIEDRVPPWMRGKGNGWVTGEYGMLPRATHTRSAREAARGKQSGRTMEISRLIGRSLRAITDLGGARRANGYTRLRCIAG